MMRRKPRVSSPPLESADHREEREARVTELLERAQRHQRLAEQHVQEAERLKADGPKLNHKTR